VIRYNYAGRLIAKAFTLYVKDVWCNSHPAYNMKSLLLSCKRFESRLVSLGNRPKKLISEPISQPKYQAGKCMVVLITIEKGDDPPSSASKLEDEIRGFSRDTGISTIVIFPFAHLSNNLASSESALHFLDVITKSLADFAVERVHFGSDKSLLLDVHGHRGNIRFRQF
jgi:threonyl-tRNA synthetase